MPPDNPATVATGEAVNFPQNGPAAGGIARLDSDEFVLPEVGTYRVEFSVPVSEAGQLELTVDGAALPYTVSGRATGTSPISGDALVETNSANTILAVQNPAGSSNALTITPLAGGTQPAAAWLIVQKLPDGP
jgi:hypothetical protein